MPASVTHPLHGLTIAPNKPLDTAAITPLLQRSTTFPHLLLCWCDWAPGHPTLYTVEDYLRLVRRDTDKDKQRYAQQVVNLVMGQIAMYHEPFNGYEYVMAVPVTMGTPDVLHGLGMKLEDAE